MLGTIVDIVTIPALLALMIVLAVVVLWLRDRAADVRSRRRNPPEKLAAERRAYEAQILDPDWEFYERHLQRPVPQSLREVYADRELVTAQQIDIGEDWFIGTFQPLRNDNLLETRAWIGVDIVAFALTDFGDPIYLRPGPREANAVYVTNHDGGETEVFTDSVDSLLVKIKNALQNPSNKSNAGN